MKPMVEVIPAEKKLTGNEKQSIKVAAYCRVSSLPQEESYESQVEHFNTLIMSHPDWKLTNVYGDEGITGLNTKKRTGFKKLVRDGERRKYDLLLVKSISRLGRNTVDLLTTIRKLKAVGVAVYFEKENINTMEASGEMMLTLLSAFSQSESESISSNVRIGLEYKYNRGEWSCAFSNFLGYDASPDGEGAVINEQQAKTVRYIFDEFLKGTALNDLSRQLQENGYKTGSGNDSWTKTGLTRILTNCKYAGDVVQGLTYTANILEKTRKRNRGDAPQYFMKDAIPAIIDRQTLLLAKGELMRREKAFHKEEVEGPVIYNRKNPFTHAVVCPDCGAFYNRKKSRDKYTLYCFNRINGSCKSPNIPESEMEQVVLEAAQKLHDKQPEIKMKKVPELKKNDEDDKLMRAAGLNTYNAFANRIVEFLKGKRPEKFDPEISINLVEKIEEGETDYKVCFYGDQAVKVKHEAFKEDKRRLKRKQ